MSKILSMDELRKMKEADLQKEIAEQQRLVSKLRLDLKRGKEKGSHLYKNAKKQLSRMLTVLSVLQKTEAASSISAPST